ncbi:hypothetical protein AB2B38_004785 [Balneola sp. MJW-20]|uniref:hypothetical protein n=1 Tax=Gracilimonas aurantiaca TaxID=3234185 RepID=UPI003465DBFC
MKTVISSLILFIAVACSQESGQTTADFEEIPAFEPQPIRVIESVGEEFFSHLGYQTAVTVNGDILLPDRQRMRIFKIDQEGNLRGQLSPGQGPGEIGDAYEIEEGADGKFYVYDQDNDKVLIMDQNGDFEDEFIPARFERGQMARIFRFRDGIVSEMTSFRYLGDPERSRQIYLYEYDIPGEAFMNERVYPAQPYAILYIDGAVRGAGLVPYSDGTLLEYVPEQNRLFAFNTDGNEIALLNVNLDTTSTINVDLPVQKFSKAELDSLEADNIPEQWDTMEELINEYKTKAQKMIVNGDYIWLKSSFDRENETWLVLNMGGEILRKVLFPKGSMVTHISDKHIGVRLDAATFALYEPLILE